MFSVDAIFSPNEPSTLHSDRLNGWTVTIRAKYPWGWAAHHRPCRITICIDDGTIMKEWQTGYGHESPDRENIYLALTPLLLPISSFLHHEGIGSFHSLSNFIMSTMDSIATPLFTRHILPHDSYSDSNLPLNDTQIGEKGTLEHTFAGVGDNRVALFFSLVRGLPLFRLEESIATCIKELPRMSLDVQILTVTDLFVLAFQTRNCRGGKGEKELFYHFLLVMFKEFPNTVLSCLPLIAKYGSYKDYFHILDKTSDTAEEHKRIRDRIVEIVAITIERDLSRLASLEAEVPCGTSSLEAECASMAQISEVMLDEEASEAAAVVAHRGRGGGKVSLCAKYLPREGSRLAKGEGNKEWLRALRRRLFPYAEGPESKKLLRQAISKLTATLDVPEVKMCAKRYREIDFSSVPSLCLNRNRRAFANDLLVEDEHSVTRAKRGKAMAMAMAVAKLSREEREERGDRFPEDEDRVQCRGALKRALVEGGVNGKQLHPHEIVRQIRKGQSGSGSGSGPGIGGKGLTSFDDLLLDVQWAKVRDSLVAKLEAAKEPQPIIGAPTPSKGAAEKGGSTSVSMDFRKLVPLVDVSGSMEGDPMDAAIALGILTSEVNHSLFRDRFITFESSPGWVDLSEAPSVVEKVRVAAAAPWGGSTNIEAAFGLICEAVLRARLPVEEVPDLIVFSDMQFDQACEGRHKSLTQLQRVQRMFHDVGLAICGRPYPAPRLVFWNLRGGPTGYPAQAHSENVQLLSGFSPSLLELALSGAPISPDGAGDKGGAVGGEDTVTRAKVTPYETFRRAMDSEAYDAVRAVLARSREEVLLHCSDAVGDPAVEQLAKGMGSARVSACGGGGGGGEDEHEDEDWEMLEGGHV